MRNLQSLNALIDFLGSAGHQHPLRAIGIISWFWILPRQVAGSHSERRSLMLPIHVPSLITISQGWLSDARDI